MILRSTELQICFSAFLTEFTQTGPDSGRLDTANPCLTITYADVRNL
jgi:hypothetical protein